MQIPLDYYRILGLPLAASEEQLRQAYSDRIVQMPRREYSMTAISSRKQLIEEAYLVLSNPQERSAYDQVYLAHTYQGDGTGAKSLLQNQDESNNRSQNVQSLSIEVGAEELVGSLLLLQELGEYEQVLKLGRPYLVKRKRPVGVRVGTHFTSEEYSATPELPDIILTVALACLELGREQWQQGHYENAAISLETGEELLMREGLFPNVQAEMPADLCKLRPYRILELLALPQEKSKERRQGFELLHNILQDRGGIDGAGNDQSGLNIDDFLRFIQQIRHYLTVSEQHKLFEAESKRPSAVATYLAVYALIARGFDQCQPALIRQAKQMLIHLGKRQDVHLEQSLCALLLGQTEEATRLLELSQEYEVLAMIREKSQDSPDLLPGLCLYCEQWLQQEVFTHFRDLVRKQASLKKYFADRQVQAYLESLPTDNPTTYEWGGINYQPLTSPQVPSPPYTRPEHLNNGKVGHYQGTDYEVDIEANNHTPGSDYSSSPEWHSRNYSDYQTPEIPQESSATTEEVNTGYEYQVNSRTSTHEENHLKRRRRRKPYVGYTSERIGEYKPHYHRRRRNLANSLDAKTRLVWLVFLSMGGLLILWLLISTAWGWVDSLFFSKPTLQGEPLAIELNQAPISIPDPNSELQPPAGELTTAVAQDVIEKWLSIKSEAFGQEHNVNRLDEILTGSVVSKWRRIVRQDIKENRYRTYKHDVQVEFINQKDNIANNAVVEATVREFTNFYERGQIKKSSNDTLRVRYDLVRKQNVWRIQGMTVVKSLNS